jgi:CRISPR system Cascade subunit CasC
VTDAFRRVLDGGKAADVALYGRMLADLPEKNIDAACQVAHAISTNAVNTEFDFYTAVDDLPRADDKGAGMMGTIEFNSACFYRYSNIDLDQLCGANLGGDEDAARHALEAFLRASIEAVPSGKVNSMAHQNPPSLVFAVVRDRRLWSLANAFTNPVAPDAGSDLVEESALRLDAYWSQLTRMYGTAGIVGTWLVTIGDGAALQHLATAPLGTQADSVDALVDSVIGAVKFAGKRAPAA